MRYNPLEKKSVLLNDNNNAIAMRYLMLCLLAVLLNCADDDADQITIREQRMAEISANVDALTANKSCNGADDCASIAWGSKPCGGPWSYLVYAPGNVDVPQLEALVAEYNRLDQELNNLKGIGSDCAVVVEPELECIENRCSAKQ
jgi:hypothetical protein